MIVHLSFMQGVGGGGIILSPALFLILIKNLPTSFHLPSLYAEETFLSLADSTVERFEKLTHRIKWFTSVVRQQYSFF